MSWLSRNASAIEAIAALITASVAVAALIAIPMQIRATAELQAKQSARDIYREFVALSVREPQFAQPEYCEIKEQPQQLTAYSYYVEYLLYTSEQVLALDEEWQAVVTSYLEQHVGFFCDAFELGNESPTVQTMIFDLDLTKLCTETPSC